MTTPQHEWIVRPAILEDIEAICTLERTQRGCMDHIPGRWLLLAIKRAGHILVVEERDRILGFIYFRHRPDGRTTVSAVVVDAAHRRQGIGQALFLAVCDESFRRNQRCLTLRCPQEMVEANAFFGAMSMNVTDLNVMGERPLVGWQIAWLYPPTKPRRERHRMT